jgi:DNA mismatch repair protein MutS
MKKTINSIFSIILLCSVAIQAEDGIYVNIADAHLATLTKRKKDITKAIDEKSLTWWQKAKQSFISKTETDALELSEYESFGQLYELLEKETSVKSYEIINGNTLSDLEVVAGVGNSKQSLAAIIGKDITTKSGKAYLHYLLSEPTSDVTILRKRQTVIAYLVEHPIVLKELSHHLKTINKSEDEFLNLWKEEENEELTKEILSLLYFDKDGYFKALNKSKLYQHGSFFAEKVIVPLRCTLLDDVAQNLILSTLIVKGMSGMPLKEAFNNQLNSYKFIYQFGADFFSSPDFDFKSKALVTGAIGAVGTTLVALKSYKVIPPAWKKNTIQKYLQKKLIHIANITRSMEAITDILNTHPELAQNISNTQDLNNYFGKNSSLTYEMKDVIALLETSTFEGEAARISLHGRVTAAFAKLQSCKNELIKGLHAVGEIDAYASIVHLMNNHQDTRVTYSFVTFDDTAQTPYITVDNMWNPFVPEDVVVTNTIDLGNTTPRSGIITGPNAGGKSTALKGLSISVVMAQSIGIAPATEMTVTPFSKISTYMNITDDTTAGKSTFEGEAIRAGKLMETVKETHAKNEFSFSILDEVFSGISPKEGAAASYSIAKKFGEITTNITLIATHFPVMTTLEENTPNYKNYQVRVDYKEDGSFAYRYKLEPGIADQNVAFAILKEKGFDIENFDIA